MEWGHKGQGHKECFTLWELHVPRFTVEPLSRFPLLLLYGAASACRARRLDRLRSMVGGMLGAMTVQTSKTFTDSAF